MIIPIFSNIIVMAFYTVLNIGIIIVSPLNPLFPFFLHHHCLQILYTTNFLRENVFYILLTNVHHSLTNFNTNYKCSCMCVSIGFNEHFKNAASTTDNSY